MNFFRIEGNIRVKINYKKLVIDGITMYEEELNTIVFGTYKTLEEAKEELKKYRSKVLIKVFANSQKNYLIDEYYIMEYRNDSDDPNDIIKVGCVCFADGLMESLEQQEEIVRRDVKHRTYF